MGKFRIKQGEKEDFRALEEFIYLQGVIVGERWKDIISRKYNEHPE